MDVKYTFKCGQRRAPVWSCWDFCKHFFVVVVTLQLLLYVMHSLAQEIQSFSKNALRKQCTRVTTLTGKRIIETWKDSKVQVVEEAAQPEGACGYVQDLSLDLQVGVIKPWLLIGEINV